MEKYNEIQITKNKMDLLTKRNLKNDQYSFWPVSLKELPVSTLSRIFSRNMEHAFYIILFNVN